ncbi:hypothetical protein CAI21_12140 [Alkalilimnicola ehrlichii]|uniref:Uncharacterized protein n=1 Tax=Alkalilimnicola ehrlichii TaxID=351052 RepID=A0A3E0WUV4_9GAMM|nr:isoprenylcysteine carboxylmethyltransferase family protein [Alkalilimnicola ehrlichii]RFA28601.1 hypothetical protein CAI21_12140 [Alkalilimnicola ehrlichii]RFA35765.1 hypothetical protein CAL65_12660 [Alkalilimnicola ehrlichii]
MRALTLPPFVMAIAIVLMIGLNYLAPLVHLWGAPYRWLGIPLVLIGLGIAKWHADLFKAVDTNIDTFGEPDTLTTEGLFRYTRNPMYLGFVIVLVGVAVLLGSITPFLPLAGFVLLTHFWYIRYEERAMLKQFGQQYVDYKSRVRRWL